MIDAATIRERLAACKQDGMSFEAAWRSVVGAVPPRRRDETVAHFTYRTMRDHYLDEDSTVVALSHDLAADPDESVAARGASRP